MEQSSNYNRILTFIFGLYLFLIPLDFLTGEYLGGTGISTIVAIVILIISVIQIISTKTVFVSKDILILILILILGLVPLIFTQNYMLSYIITFIFYISSLFSCVNLIKMNKINYDILIFFSLIGILLMSIYLLTNGTLGYGGSRLTTHSRNLNPNVASGSVLMGLGLSIYFSNKKKYRLFSFVSIIILLVTLFLLQSKTSFLSLFGGILVLSTLVISKIIKRKKMNLKLLFKIIFYGLIFLVFITLVLNYFESKFELNFSSFNRLDSLFSGNISEATTGRSSIWETGLNNSNLIFGEGIFAYRKLFNRSAHSLYISIFVETGIFGIILLGAFFTNYIFKTYKNIYPDFINFLSVIFIIITLVIFGFGNDILEYKFSWLGLILTHIIYNASIKEMDYVV